ncbi:Aste57867_9009 [Aphanomyces stellatus]|uniref:Aste57867_9009 protein n=1 Tax=Aphanomyces stellatus TaxID=120398 RepID=A0A485KLY7_9STRA|nr:hypothetical protein As57867_008974 [Aphanomyces stellatus]VFT85893.1 Aste57867_9009 [Aphanomyces stellatus]
MNADDIQWIRSPFSSLREESVLMELYASLDEAAPSSAPNVPAAATLSTCVNGVTMSLDELNQDADVARLLLFARHPHNGDESKETANKPTKKRKASPSTGVNPSSLVMKEPSLLGQSPEALAATLRQAKKGSLVERMFQAIDSCVLSPSPGPSAAAAKARNALSGEAVILEPSPEERDSFPLKVFSLASCRMQLTMLRALGPDVRVACLVDLVHAMLDFPTMALSTIKSKSAEEATLHALYAFGKGAMADHIMGDGMLLVAALGVSSGRIRYLLRVLQALLQHPCDFHMDATCVAAFDRVLTRLETYHPTTSLSLLEDHLLTHSIRVKPDGGSDGGQRVALASDGTFLYTWSTTTGLKKIGTGTGGSVSGRVYQKAPAGSFLPYFADKRPVLRAICGTFELVTPAVLAIQGEPPTVHSTFGDGQLLVVFKTAANGIQDLVFEPLDCISLPTGAILAHAAFGAFVDVTPAVQQVDVNGIFSDDLSALPDAQLLVVQSPLASETDIRCNVYRKGDVLFKPHVPTSTSLVAVGDFLYLNLSPSSSPAVEFLKIGPRDLRVKGIVALDPSTQTRTGVRLQYVTEGDYLYDVRLHDHHTIGVHIFDMTTYCRTVLLSPVVLTGMPHFYTNGRTLTMVAARDACTFTQFDLHTGAALSQTKTSTSIQSSAVSFDSRSNVLWSLAPTRNCVECFHNKGSWVCLRDKKVYKVMVSPDDAWKAARDVREPGLRWLLSILAKLHQMASTQLKQTAQAAVPLAVDVCAETFEVLIQCVDTYGARFCQADGAVMEPWETYVLMASLVVLTANVGSLNLKEDVEIVDLILKSRLADALSTLVRFPAMDNPIVRTSLQLYMASLDIFYKGPLDQLALVAKYLELMTSGTLHASELPILKLLLQRLTDMEKLKDIVLESASFEYVAPLVAHSVKWHATKPDDADIARELVSLIYSMTQALLWGYHRQRVGEIQTWACFEAMVQACVNLVQAKPDVALLEHSIVGQVCPLLFTAMQHFPWRPDKCTYERMCDLLGTLLVHVGQLNHASGDATKEIVVESACSSKITKYMESSHEYQNNMHVLTELRVAGATTLTITFDERSRTEVGYDYVTFFKDDSQTEYYGEEKYSGRADEHNWPGVGANPPLEIDAESCHVLFHSDGSGVDWGYKFTAVGLVESQVTCLSLPWLVHVEETLMAVLTTFSTTLVRGKVFTPITSTENAHAALLNSRLLQGGKQTASDHVVDFLRNLVDPADESVAATVAGELKKKTVQDQGAIPHINRAVRAVAVAILHHNLWGMEVVQYSDAVKGESPTPLTSHVLQAWKTAQKMRQWFDLGDAAEATIHRPSTTRPGLKRQPSAYKGATEEAIMQLCESVVSRALFLLEFTPASFSFVRAAKLRWNLLAKYTTAIHRKNSWLHLVHELNAATELKTLLDYRRTSMERLKAPKSITELVLEFVQSDVDVSEMQTILATRNERATSRVLGIATIAKALAGSSSGRLQNRLLEGMALSMRQIGLEDCCVTNLHFFNSLNGCDETKRKGLSEAVALCLKSCAKVLSIKSPVVTDDSMEAALISSALKAIAMDYDVRDSYLLYDSKVLPHILRLLPSENLRIRRAAQSIIRVLLSHFVAIQEDQDDVPNLSAFQKQLLAAVRLQLEGIVANVHQKHDALCLSRSQMGFCAPSVPLLADHSISFWMFVEEPMCQYALKVGDEVRRGPHWVSTQDEDGGESGVGSIVAIGSPTTVQVKWFNTNQTTTYTWDPSLPLYEVQLVDEGVGGMVFLQGNRNLVCDTDEMAPWSHYGLFLTDEGQLKYVMSSGVDKDVIFESTDAVHMNAWNHVCLVKEESLLKLYLNGSLDSQHTVDDKTSSSSHHVVVETIHPCLGQGDVHRWPVSFPGAARLVVTFDPMTQIDKTNGDYVCFYATSSNEDEVWGQSMYTHDFPGVDSEGPLVIPADSTVVFFYSSTQTVKWGFRLLIAAEYDDNQHAHQSLNAFPFYFGEPPPRVLDAPSARCWLSHFGVRNVALKDHEVSLHMRLDSQESSPHTFPIDRALQTLGLIQTCAETPFGRTFITNSVLIRHLIVVAFMGAVETQCGALYVLVELSPNLSVAMLDDAFQRAFPSSTMTFIETIWENLGAILNVWPHDYASVHCHSVVDVQPSALSAMSLVQAYAALIRALAKTPEWLERIHAMLLATLDHNTAPADFSLILASVAVLGGSYDGVGIGSRVRCCVNIDGKESIEVGSVIQFRLKGESRMACVLFDCDNSRPVDVPISDIAADDDEDNAILAAKHMWDDPSHVEALLQRLERLLQLWHDIQSHPDRSGGAVRYKPQSKIQDKVEVLESDHPYANDTDITYVLDFPGADAIVIVFDALSSTESDCDFVRFQKRDGSGTTYGDERYSGSHFPGVGSVPPLVIPASSVDVLFHSDSSNTDWGFRLHATAKLETRVLPPEVPPSPTTGAWSDLRARILKAVARHTRRLAPSLTRTMMAKLAHTAVAPYVGRALTSMPKSQVFESKHPYANSISEYMAVTFKGANMLTISFDPLSRTEHGCDYVVFFKDKSLGDRWGEHQYTGRAGSENWPGCGGGPPPLMIPAEGFTLLWCTDSSNVDWGWKFIVKASFPSVSPLELTSEQLNQRTYHVTEMLYEQMQYQATPVAAAFDGFERDVASPQFETQSIRVVPPAAPPTDPSTSWYRVQAHENAGLYQSPNDKSTVVDVLTHHMHVKIRQEHHEWVEVETKAGDGGWMKKRKGDTWLLHPLDAQHALRRLDEDTVVVGVDDMPDQYKGVDDENDEQDELANFASHFTLEELKGHLHRLHSLAVETYDASAIQSARQSLLAMFALVPCPFTAAACSPSVLLELLVVLVTQSPATHKKDLEHQLYDWVHTTPALLPDLLAYATATLRRTMQSLPRSRAMVRSLESAHPYNDNVDTYWRIDMPGASRIKVVFDSRSKTEAGCDWMCFYAANDRTITYGETQYSGRGGSENWPGFGSRPPLIIESDRFEVYFHTDGSGNDWGWAFTAYGIVSDDDSTTPSDATHLDKSLICCWLLKTLTAMPNATSATRDVLYSAQTLQSWLEFLSTMPRQIKLEVLAMVTNVALDHSTWKAVSKHIGLWQQLRSLVKKRMRAQHKAEERQELKTPYFQALVQCSLALDYAVETCGFETPATDAKQLILKPPSHDSAAPYVAALTQCMTTTDAVFAWQIDVKTCTNKIVLGLEGVTDKWSVGWTSHRATDATSENRVTLLDTTAEFKQGDTVRIECDLLRRVVCFRCNSARIYEGPLASSSHSFHPIVHLLHPSDAVVVSMAPPFLSLDSFQDPIWYSKVMDSMSALVMETMQRPCVVVRESSHPMSEDAWQDTIHVPRAVKLEIRFDRQTQLGSKDSITLVSPTQQIVLTGLDGKTTPDHMAFGPEEMKPTLRNGDIVVRTDDWVYGNEDGGPGQFGHVIEVIGWKQRPGMGVKVKWVTTKHENVYRFGYNGYYDVALASTRPPSVLWIEGDTVQVSVTPFRLASGKESGFHGSLDFNRQTCLMLYNAPNLNLCDDFSIQFWIRVADFKGDKRPETIFFAGHPKSNHACMHLSISSDLKLHLLFKTDDFLDSMVTEPLVPSSHTWTHVTITSSGSDVTLYKFGDKWAHHTFYGRASYTTPFESMYWGHTHGLSRLGFKPYGGFAGQLYDIQLWNAPLSATDIRRTLFDKARVDDLYPPPSSSGASPWATVNQSGKDFMSVRSSLSARRGKVYYEVTLLSSGTILVGWVHANCALRRKTAGIGDCLNSYAIDVNRQSMWHNGPCPFSSPASARGKAGDVIGCLLDCDVGHMAFTLNGQPIGDTFTAPASHVASTAPSSVLKIAPLLSPKAGSAPSIKTPTSRSLSEANVAELLDMGCSRSKAIEALERNEQNVAQALEWLLHHPDDKPPTVAAGPPVALVKDAAPAPNQWQDGDGLRPAVSLSPMGSQGVQWNFGQTPFAHAPDGTYAPLWSASDAPAHVFEVYDWAEDGWERIKVRHRLQDITPQLLHRYVLNEGEGVHVEDVKGGAPGLLVSVGTASTPKPWKGWIYSPIHNQGVGAWGYRFSVLAHFHHEGLPRTRFLTKCGSHPPPPQHRRATMQLVQYTNQKNRQMDSAHLLRAAWTEFALHDDDWVRWPLLCVMASGATPTPDATSEFNQDALAHRFKWLQEFNLAMHRILPLTCFDTGAPAGSLSAMISGCRGLIFQTLKKGLWDDCLKLTQRSGVSLEMTLNRPKAMRHRATGLVDVEARTTLFAQAFRQLNASENHHFRRSDNVYYVKFLGENAEDAGGPYRETFAQYAAELHSAQLPMLQRTPNAAHNVGLGREKWVVNPTAFHSVRLRRRILAFLGKLMGASVRSKDYFALDLAGLMWKLMVNEDAAMEDLEALDKMLVQSMSKMRSIDQLGVTEEMFEDIVLETFTTLATDGRVVEIKPHGAGLAVTFATRIEFADLVEQFRLHEFDAVVQYIQEGLAKVLPLNLMSLFTALEFESMVCGSPEVDVDLLVQGTEYSSCAATDPHIVWFWNTLRKFSHEERSAFLRFVWGRSRLPHTVAEFPQWFKLQSFNKAPADSYLPVAHTCFFALELPAYSSEELLVKKLLYAIYNCQEIDADGDSVAANQLGWEE